MTVIGVADEDITVRSTVFLISRQSHNHAVQDGAYADVVVKTGPIKILQKEFDVCEEA